MKKLAFTVLAMVSFASFSIAQTVAKTATPAAKPKTAIVKKDAAPATPTKVTTFTPAKPTVASALVKNDGTPDKRFKANRNLKKDGTSDKRFKANKKS